MEEEIRGRKSGVYNVRIILILMDRGC